MLSGELLALLALMGFQHFWEVEYQLEHVVGSGELVEGGQPDLILALGFFGDVE